MIIASLGHIAYKLVALPSITNVQGLKGKIIGSSRIGAGTDYALKRLLPKLGLTPGKDVQLIPTGISESDRRLVMMLQGKIDATLATEDNLLQLGARERSCPCSLIFTTTGSTRPAAISRRAGNS